jgi:hypothetical protein
MPTPKLPEFEEVQSDLKTLWPDVFEAFEAACQETRSFFDERDKPVDRALASNIVRYLVIQHLEKNGFDAVAEVVEREALANNGISLLVGRYHLRFRKATHGGVPAPGESQTLQGFYGQQMTFAFPGIDPPAPPADIVNVLVLWDVTATYKFIGLSLACPVAGGEGQNSVSLHWGPTELQHPAEQLSAEADEAADLAITAELGESVEPVEDDLLVEPAEASGTAESAPDLPIEADGEDEAGAAGVTK